MFLIVSATFPPEPVVSANISNDIASALVKKGKVVTVISPKPTRPFGHKFEAKKDSKNLFDHIILKSYVQPKSKLLGRIFESISFGWVSRNYIRSSNKEIDYIYMNTWPIFSQYLIIREARKYKIPVITHIQDVYPESFLKKAPKLVQRSLSTILTPIDNFVLKNSTKVICISDNMKKYLIKNRTISKSKIAVIRNWQNDELFIKQNDPKIEENDCFTFMYVGSVSKSAGVDLLIRSFMALDSDKNYRMVIAGSGSEKENCIRLAVDNKKIEFWDAPNDMIPEIQSKADILLLCLKKGVGQTASPSKFTAYLFSKKPVLAAVDDNSDTADCIRTSNCGFVVTPEDENILTNKMSEILLMSNKELAILGENGFKFALNNLRKKSNLEKLIKILIQ